MIYKTTTNKLKNAEFNWLFVLKFQVHEASNDSYKKISFDGS